MEPSIGTVDREIGIGHRVGVTGVDFVIVSGPPGSGKTTFGEPLAAWLEDGPSHRQLSADSDADSQVCPDTQTSSIRPDARNSNDFDRA